jgi:hypothetical protein
MIILNINITSYKSLIISKPINTQINYEDPLRGDVDVQYRHEINANVLDKHTEAACLLKSVNILI